MPLAGPQAPVADDDEICRVGANGVEQRLGRVTGDDAAKVLIEESSDVDLLVVGTRGRGGFRGLVLGSVSQHVAGYAKCPVTVVR